MLLAPFKIRSDSISVRYLSTLKDQRSPFPRYFQLLADFTFTAEHRPGKTNIPDDSISRRDDLPEMNRDELDFHSSQSFVDQLTVAQLEELEDIAIEFADPYPAVWPSQTCQSTDLWPSSPQDLVKTDIDTAPTSHQETICAELHPKLQYLNKIQEQFRGVVGGITEDKYLEKVWSSGPVCPSSVPAGPPGVPAGPPTVPAGLPTVPAGPPMAPAGPLMAPAGWHPGSSTVRHPSSPGHDLRPGPLPRPQGWPGPPQGLQGCLVMTQARHCTAPMWRPQGRPKIYHHFTICPGSGSQTRLLARQGQSPPLTLPFTPSTGAKQPSPGRPGPTNGVGQARHKARHRAPARLNTPRLTRPLALEIARLPSWPPAGLPA